MKRISLALALILALCMLGGLVSCGGDGEETELETYTEIDYDALIFNEYVTLGQYRGAELTIPPVSINMNAIESALQKIVDEETTFEEYPTPVTDRATEAGDYVEIDFDVYFDGQLFEAGCARGVALLLDDNNGFFEWLDDDLYGVMPGATVTTKGIMPEDGYYGSYAGQEGTFEITLVSIKAHYNIPALTDELVARHSEHSTVEAFREAMYNELYAEAEETLEANKLSAAWTAALKGAEILKYPEQQVMYYYTTYRNNIMTEANKYGHTYEEHLEAVGLTDEGIMEGARELVAEELVFYAIVEAESYSISDEEYETGVAEYAARQEMSVEQFEAYYEKDYIIDNLLWDKTMYALKDMAVFTFEQ